MLFLPFVDIAVSLINTKTYWRLLVTSMSVSSCDQLWKEEPHSPFLSALHCEFVSLVMLNQRDMQSTNLNWDSSDHNHTCVMKGPSLTLSASKCLCVWGRRGKKVRGRYWSLLDQWLTLTVAIAAECLISLLRGNAINYFVTLSSFKIPSPSSLLWHLTQRKLKLAIFHFVSK